MNTKYVKMIAFAALLICSVHAIAQTSGDSKVDNLIAQLKKQNKNKGTMHFTAKGAVVDDGALITKTDQGLFVIGNTLSFSAEHSQLNIVVNSITNGKQTLPNEKQRKSFAMINGIAYQVGGEIVFKVTGKTVSASFTGDLYEVNKKSSKANTTSSGSITATFKNLILP